MKKILFSLCLSIVVLNANAQTLNVVVGEVTYQIPASQAGDMVYTNGQSVTILNKTFTLSDITKMYVDNTTVNDNSVSVEYNGSSASVKVAGNIMQYLTASASGADVNLVQSADLSDEITYTLSGSSTDGSLYMDGELKASFVLNGLNLTNADGYAIDIEDGKRISVELADGTTNTLVDGANGSQKACFMVNGHTEFKGGGTLSITGNTKHAFWGDEYVQLKKSVGAINILGAVSDGFNINQYFEQNGGQVTISGVGDDGIQVAKIGEGDENDGQILINGGSETISVTAEAAKGMNAESDITISGGTCNVSTTGGGKWDSDALETKASACIKSDADILISDGTLTLSSTGTGGKGMSCDSTLTVNGGTINITTSGAKYTYGNSSNNGYGGHTSNTSSSYSSSAKGIKADENITINSGTFDITTSGEGAEGIESKAVLTVNDGIITVKAIDDAINSSSHMYIKGGTITTNSTTNDGLDANGNLYIQGGRIIALGSSAPECGIDANEEGGYHAYFTGGTLLATGGGNSVPTSASQPYVTTTGSVTANGVITLKSGTTTLATFTIPSSYTTGSTGSNSGMSMPQSGNNQSGSSSMSILVTCSGLTSSSSYTLQNGSTSTSVTAKK